MARNPASTQNPYREARNVFEARYVVPKDMGGNPEIPRIVTDPAQFEAVQAAKQEAVERAVVAAIFAAVLPHVGRHVDSVV